jgi:hypothetical protein
MEDEAFKTLCRETVTGQNYNGRLTVSDRRMQLKLISFGRPIHLDFDHPIVLELEDGRVATLLECAQAGGGGHTYSFGRSVHSEVVTPHTVIIGVETWETTSRVRSATFRFFGSEIALLATGILERSIEPGDAERQVESLGKQITTLDLDKMAVLNISSDEADVRIFMGTSYSRGPLKEAIQLHPTIAFDFDSGMSLNEYFSFMLYVVWFFSLSIGYASRPFEIRIDEATSEQQRTLIDHAINWRFHEIRYHWSKSKPYSSQTNKLARGAVFQAVNEEEKAATAASLNTWLNRRKDWQAAAAQMNYSLRKQGILDRDRLFAAFAWFEAIPLNERSAEFCPDQIKAIAKAAAAEAKRQRPDADEERIINIVGILGNEKSVARFDRLIKVLRDRFGNSLVPDWLFDACERAVNFRGAAIHGSLAHEEETSMNFLKSVFAVEYVSFLLMIKDLPLSDVAETRFKDHPFASYLHVWPR